MDFIHLPSLMDKYLLVMIYMFSHWTTAFSCRQATTTSVGKDDPYLETPSNFTEIREPILLVRSFDNSVLFGPFYDTFTVYHPQSSGLIKCSNGTIGTQLAEKVLPGTKPLNINKEPDYWSAVLSKEDLFFLF